MAKEHLIDAGIVCGRSIILSLCSIIGAGFIVGWLIEHSDAVFQTISNAWGFSLFLASMGGEFWGAVGLGVSMMSVVAWVVCVGDKLQDKELQQHIKFLVAVGIAAVVVWLLSYFGMQQTFNSMKELSPYGVIGVIVMSLPFVGLVIGAMGLAIYCLDH